MVDQRKFEGLVASIYEAGADFHLWPETLRRIADAYHARTVVFASYSERVADLWSIAPDIDQSVHDRYAAYYHGINPICRLTHDMPAGDVRTDAMIVPRQQFVGTEFFHDFLRPQDIGSMLGVAAHNKDGRLCVVSVQRKRIFDDDEVASYRRIAPHVRRAVQLNLAMAQLEMRCTASAEALDMLDRAVLLVDERCKVLLANRVAERLIGAGGALRLVDGVIQARCPAETSRLQALVATCGAAGSAAVDGTVTVSRGSQAAPIALAVLPLRTPAPAFQLASPPVAMILFDDPDTQPASSAAERIRRRYGLSPRETAFALEILKGDGIGPCADRLGISRATARTHLAHIFQKTGARRQAELVRLLMQA